MALNYTRSHFDSQRLSSIVQNSSQSSGYPIISYSYTLLSEKFINIVISIFKFSSIMNFNSEKNHQAVADLRGVRGMRAPLGVRILSISCIFGENLAKLYVGAPLGSWCPLLGEILDPPLSRDLANLDDFEPTLREAVADLHSKILDARPPSRSNFLHFHTVYGEIWPNNRLAPPHLGNPGSAATR